jgi:dienelactone hydrolase
VGVVASANQAPLAQPQSERQVHQPLHGRLERGAYDVGFRLFTEYDSSRPALPSEATSTRGRQMPIAMWYPSVQSAQAHMQVRDYVLASGEATLGQPAAGVPAVNRFSEDAASRGIERAAVERLLGTETAAARDAAPVRERFPLVLFAHASPETVHVMCEYLASNGFVVAAVKSRGAADVDYRLSRENLDAMVSDLAFVATRLTRDLTVAAGGVGVIGMSNGAIAGMGLQLQRHDVSAVVSLDGGIGEDAGGTFLKERASGDVSRLAAPILHLYAPDNPHLNLAHLRSYTNAARTLVFVRGMRHQDFLAYPMFDRVVDRFSGAPSTDAIPGFEWASRYTLRFLKAMMQRDTDSAEWLTNTPESHGAPAGLLALERLAVAGREIGPLGIEPRTP